MRRAMRRWLPSLLLACLAASPRVAAAQVDGGSDFDGRTPVSMRNGMPHDPDIAYPGSGHLGVDLGVFFREHDDGSSIRSFVPVVEGWYAPSERLAISLWIPMYAISLDTPEGFADINRLGNVTLGAHLGASFGRTSVMAGLELATPTARIGDGDIPEREPFIRETYAVASMVGGHARRWLWWPERMAAVVPLRMGHRILPALTLGLEATGAIGLAVGDEEHETVEVGGTVTPQATVNVGEVVAGLRAPVSGSSMRRYQVAVEPFVRWFLDSVYLLAAFTLNIAGDSDFAFSEEGVWAVHLGGGAVFGEDRRELRDDPGQESPAED